MNGILNFKKKSKVISALLTLAMMFMLIPGAVAEGDGEETPVEVTGVTLDELSITLYIGGDESETLTATVAPTDATDKSVSWKSGNTNVATVNDGVVTAQGEGNTTITVKTTDGGFTSTCSVEVLPPVLPTAQSIADGITSITDPAKGAVLLILPSVPDGFTRSIVSSSNESVIDIDGSITPPTVNTIVTLTLRITREFDKETANTIGLNVTVPAKEAPQVKKVTEVTIGSSSATVRLGKTLQMTYTVKPSDATDKSVTWSVTNGTDKATINSSGLLTPSKIGKVTVRATAKDGSGKYGTKDITITSASTILVDYILVEGDDDETSVAEGKTLKMIATVYPSNASNKSVTWSVQNGTGDAKISSTGVLTGVKEGNVTVIAKAKDGSGVEGKRIIKITKGEDNDNLVDKAGGTVEELDVIVSIPKDAVSREVEIDIGKTSSKGLTISEGYKLVSDVYYISKNRSGDFSKNITITIPFNKKGLDQKKDALALYIWDENDDEWIALSSIRVDWSKETVRGTIDYLGKFAVLAEVEEVIIPVVPTPKPETVVLKDISSHWAKTSINKLVASGAIKGYPDNTFRPDQTITRAEFAAVLVKAFNLPTNTQKVFNDTRGHWAQIQIASAYAAGVISGYDAKTFGPDDPITREQMAVMIVKAANIASSSTTLKFSDSNSVSTWARSSVATAVSKKLITGYPNNTFKPANNATRAEAVAVTVLAQK